MNEYLANSLVPPPGDDIDKEVERLEEALEKSGGQGFEIDTLTQEVKIIQKDTPSTESSQGNGTPS